MGQGWPAVNVRHEMLSEAIDIISQLFDGGYVNYLGRHYRVDSAKLWDLPARRVPVAVAISGEQSIQRFAPMSDSMIATEPHPALCRSWDQAARGRRKVGQIPVAWGRDRDAAVQRAPRAVPLVRRRLEGQR